MAKITKAGLQSAIIKSKGFVAQAAIMLGVTSKTVYNALDRWPDLWDTINEQREQLKDMAEGSLLNQIKAGNTTATIFYLKTQAKDRGYVERQEITGADGGAIDTKIVIQYADPNPHTA